MKTRTDKYSKLFISLTETITEFLQEVNKHSLQDIATTEWTVKDILCHIAFWHDYYAQNYSVMAAGAKPFLFVSKGGSTRNQDGVNKLKHKSQKYLITSINKSQTSLYDSIVIKKVLQMTYIVGHDYKTADFLQMIIGHIQRHTLQVKRAKKVS